MDPRKNMSEIVASDLFFRLPFPKKNQFIREMEVAKKEQVLVVHSNGESEILAKKDLPVYLRVYSFGLVFFSFVDAFGWFLKWSILIMSAPLLLPVLVIKWVWSLFFKLPVTLQSVTLFSLTQFFVFTPMGQEMGSQGLNMLYGLVSTCSPEITSYLATIPLFLQIYQWGLAIGVFVWDILVAIPFSGRILQYLLSSDWKDRLFILYENRRSPPAEFLLSKSSSIGVLRLTLVFIGKKTWSGTKIVGGLTMNSLGFVFSQKLSNLVIVGVYKLPLQKVINLITSYFEHEEDLT